MKLSANDLLNLKIIDEIIPEPLGGAHRDKNLILENVRNSIEKSINDFGLLNREEIYNKRKEKFLSIGRTKGFTTSSTTQESLSLKTSLLTDLLNKFKKHRNYFIIGGVLIFTILGILII